MNYGYHCLLLISMSFSSHSLVAMRSNAIELCKALEANAYEEAWELTHTCENLDYWHLQGYCPLVLAARKGLEKFVAEFLKKGALRDVADKSGRNALMWAVAQQHEGVVKLLLEGGCKIDFIDTMSNLTPLHYGASIGNRNIVERLLIAGADKTIRCNELTPDQIAANEGYEELAQFIRGFQNPAETEIGSGCVVQ